MSAGTPVGAVPALPYHLACGHWKDETYAIHGPNGYIACGLTSEQSKPILAELNRLHALAETHSN